MTNAAEFPTAPAIAELCFKKFNALPKTGKPTAKEWTILAGVVLQNTASDSCKVVALGAGTKCIGPSKFSGNGLILNDSHAEVLARRALLRFIYQELQKCTDSAADSIFIWRQEQLNFCLKDGINFHFMSTQTPCGDACIVETDLPEDDVNAVPAKKPKLADNVVAAEVEADVGNLLPSKPSDEIYTGAKLIGDQHVDVMQQTLGAVRTKPGRGERTLSMSCSDKLAKWNVLGVQGALLDELLAAPVYFATLNFCCNSKEEALKRAIYGRFLSRTFISGKYKPQVPQIRICSEEVKFSCAQDADKQPTPNGLVWCDIAETHKPYEICVHGKRQGVTVKKLHTPQAALKISKYELLKTHVDLLQSRPELLQKLKVEVAQLKQLTYSEFKQSAKNYQEAWSLAKCAYFQQWTQKPQDLLNFSIEKVESIS